MSNNNNALTENLETDLENPSKAYIEKFIETRRFFTEARLTARYATQEIYKEEGGALRGHIFQVENFTVSIHIENLENTPTAFITFQGTNDKADVRDDMKLAQIPCHEFGGMVHTGFYRGYQKLIDKVRKEFDARTSHLTNKASLKIMFTGHSLGGALATLSAMHFINCSDELGIRHNNIWLYTFGCPQLGDEVFNNKLDFLMPERNLHLALTWDPVTYGLGATALLKAFGLNYNYRHPRNRLWMNMRGFMSFEWYSAFSVQMVDATLSLRISDIINHAGEDYIQALNMVQQRVEAPVEGYNYNWRYPAVGTYAGSWAFYLTLEHLGIGAALLAPVGLPILGAAGVALIAASNIEYIKQRASSNSYVARVEAERRQQTEGVEEGKAQIA